MANRHLSRSIVLQTLFEWDFLGSARKADDVVSTLERNIAEFAPGVSDSAFMKNLLTGVLGKRLDLDLIIERAAPEWPLDRISTVDRNILRIGLYELLFADRSEVPAKVAINEAIELAKSFGGENSGRFVNGVLGAVYKEIGEPGKDEVGKRKKDVPYEKMPIERLAGAVVFAREKDAIYLALVHDIFGHWTLSKGHLVEGETFETGIIRVIKVEMGLSNGVIVETLGDNEYIASQPDKGKIRKQVSYFLIECPYQDITLEKGGGLDDSQWFRLNEILGLNFYDDILPLVTKAINLLVRKDVPTKKKSA